MIYHIGSFNSQSGKTVFFSSDTDSDTWTSVFLSLSPMVFLMSVGLEHVQLYQLVLSFSAVECNHETHFLETLSR